MLGQFSTVLYNNVLYECKTWSVYLREVHWLRLFANRLLRKIIVPKRDVETTTLPGALSCTTHKILFDDQIEKKEMAVYVARLGESRCVYRVLAGKPEGIIALGRTRLTRKNNIQKDLQ
jgi:hypothetical protein